METGASRLLDSSRTLLITTFERNRDFMLCKVITTDFHGDGKLDNFKQISPENAHVVSWAFTNPSGTVLLQTVIDSNKDKKFGSDDQSIPLIYNPSKDQTSKETFAKAFNDKVSSEFSRLYQSKDQ